MWAVLYRLASPKYFFYQTRWPLNLIGLVALVSLIIGLMLGLIFSPPDYQQGDAVRMMYVHVPAAFLSLSLYAFMAFCAILLLVWQIKLAGIMLSAAAKTGASMALIALVTGSLWGKPMWGTWWVWGDARLNLTAILLLVYLGYIASRQFNKDLAKTAKNSSIIGIFGIIQIPILHFSVIWWRSVHQQASILSQETVASGDAPMSSDILVTLLISVLLVTLVHIFLTKRFRISNDISWEDYLNPQSRAKI